MNTMKKNPPLEQCAHFSLLISNLQIAAASPATHACAHTRQRYREKKKKCPGNSSQRLSRGLLQCLEQGMLLCTRGNHAISSVKSQLKHRPFCKACNKPVTSPSSPSPALPPYLPPQAQPPCTAEQLFGKTGELSSEAPVLFMSLGIRATRFTASKWQ